MTLKKQKPTVTRTSVPKTPRPAPRPDGEFVQLKYIATMTAPPRGFNGDDYVFVSSPPNTPVSSFRVVLPSLGLSVSSSAIARGLLWVAWGAFALLCLLSLVAAVLA